jgi:hypothetical protein
MVYQINLKNWGMKKNKKNKKKKKKKEKKEGSAALLSRATLILDLSVALRFAWLPLGASFRSMSERRNMMMYKG